MNEENKELVIFILKAIEKLSEAILTGDYDNREIHEISQMAGIHLFEVEKMGL